MDLLEHGDVVEVDRSAVDVLIDAGIDMVVALVGDAALDQGVATSPKVLCAHGTGRSSVHLAPSLQLPCAMAAPRAAGR